MILVLLHHLLVFGRWNFQAEGCEPVSSTVRMIAHFDRQNTSALPLTAHVQCRPIHQLYQVIHWPEANTWPASTHRASGLISSGKCHWVFSDISNECGASIFKVWEVQGALNPLILEDEGVRHCAWKQWETVTQCNITEDLNPYQHCCGDLKYHVHVVTLAFSLQCWHIHNVTTR